MLRVDNQVHDAEISTATDCFIPIACPGIESRLETSAPDILFRERSSLRSHNFPGRAVKQPRELRLKEVDALGNIITGEI